MVINEQCMKDILIYLDGNSTITVNDFGIRDNEIRTPGITELLNDLSKTGKYSIEEVAYNFIKCCDMDFISANLCRQGSVIKAALSDIYGITKDGENFIKTCE